MFKRTAMYAALATVIGGMSPFPSVEAASTPVSQYPGVTWEYVRLPRGVYAGDEPGLKLVHDYGAFQLWKVDAAHRNELKSIVGASARIQRNSIDVPGGSFDPIKDHGPSDKRIPERAKSSTGPTVYIVQFVGPLTDAWLDAVRATGARTIQYINSNAYQVLVDPADEQALQALPASKPMLRYVGEMSPAQKLSATLAGYLDQASSAEQFHATVIVAEHEQMGVTQSAIEALVNPRKDWYDLRGMHGLEFDGSADAIRQIAALGDVLVVEPAGERKRLDEVQAQIMAGNLTAGNTLPSGTGYLGWLTGLGFSTTPADYPIVSIVDDGIGDGTTTAGGGDFRLTQNGDGSTSRLVFSTSCDGGSAGAAGTDGHGHLNATIAGGYDQNIGFPYRDPDGYLRGQGINPFARLANIEIFGTGGPSNCGSDDYGVVEAQGVEGIKISSNSWGYGSLFGPTTDYIAASRAYDIGVRDADSAAPGNQELTFIFAAGNDGPTANTVAAPGNAKNVITVGASENVRPSDEDGDWSDGCIIGPTGADNAMDVIDFSSRGPSVGGRTKPELIAPGTHVQGSASTATGYTGNSVCDQYRPSGQTSLASSSGTSHSTPAVAGAASLVYRWLQTEYGLADPSPALIKSYLIAHPTYLSGTGANDDLPSNTQGYGIPDLTAAFDNSTDRIIEDQTATFTDPGQTHVIAASVADTAKPVRLVLSWTDAPGAASSSSPQVNDLDFSVSVDGTPYIGNVFTGAFSTTGGSADSANNYEAVFLPAGTSGTIEITVTAAGINGDGVPGDADLTDQDFALVCSNCTASPVFTVSADPGAAAACAGDSLPWNVDVAALNGYTGTVTLSLAGTPAGAGTGFSVNPVVAPGSSILTVDTTGVATGDYFMDIIGNDGADSRSDTVSLQVDEVVPLAPGLTMPADTATDVDTQPTFTWSAVPGARAYTLEVDDDSGFGSIDYTATVSTTTHSVPTSLAPTTTYYWRVRADNHCGMGADSATFSFTTANLVCQTFPGAGLPAAIGPGANVITDSIAAVSGLAGATITDVNVLGLRGTHTFDGDMDVDLIAPDATTVRLFQDICGGSDNFHLNLDDSAATAVGAVCPPGDPGAAAIDASPANPLSGFNAVDPDGDWTLRITDDAFGDGGQFEAWTLEICALVSTSAVLALDDTFNATEDTQLNVSAPGVLGNDTGAGITASLTTAPTNGSLVGGVVNADGSFSYMPAPDACGVAADSFTYTATDGIDSDTATVTIDITCTNDAPVADNEAYNANINATLNVAAPGVLDGDTDIDGDPLTATNLVQPANGTVVLSADGSFSYTPDAAYCNDGSPTDDFTYTANDGTVDSAPATVAMTVICDSLPTAVDDSITVAEGGTASMLDGGNTSVKQNDTDVEDGTPGGDVTLVTGPTFAAAFTLNADGTFSYTHDDSENFSDSFTYTVADSSGGISNEATVSITITPVADTPEIAVTPGSLSYSVDTGTTDSANLGIQNVGASSLDWALLDGPLAVDPALDEPFVLGDFDLTNDGAPVTFNVTGGVASSGQVVGVRFQGTVAFNPGGTFSWASDTCMSVRGPNGETFVLGGFNGASQAGCNTNAWLGNAAGAYDESYPNGFDPAAADAGNWTITFTNDWVSGSAATLEWSGVTVTLLKTQDASSCDPVSSVGWLSAAPMSGSTGAGLTDNVSVDVDASGLAHGTYNATLCVTSNDSVGNQVVAVPVQMDVAAPVIDLAPAALAFSVAPDATDSQNLTVGNIGGLDLNWSIDEAVGISMATDVASEARFATRPVTASIRSAASGGASADRKTDRGTSSSAPVVLLADTQVSQTYDNVIAPANSAACPTGPNSLFRRYYFAEHPQVSNPAQINSVDIGIQEGVASQTLTVNVYTIPSSDPVDTITLANLTMIGTGSITISAADDGSIVNVPLDAIAIVADTAANDLVVEATVADVFYIGATTAGGSHPGFVAASACGLTTPTPIQDLGPDFADSNPIMIVNAEDVCAAPTDIPWLSLSSTSGTTAPASSSLSSVSVDSTGMAAGSYNASLCVNSNDVAAPVKVLPVSLTVTAPNSAPGFTKGADQTVDEDAGAQSVTGWATAIDDGDGGTQNLTFNVIGNTNATLFSVAPSIAANGDLSYTPADDAFGSADITIELMDDGGTGGGGVDTSPAQVFTITVNPVNDAPVANADSYGVDEGAVLAGATVKANDTDVEDGTPGGNVSLGAGPSNASAFTLNPDGSFSYTHDGTETTTDSFTYTVQDADGAASNVATVTITVNPVNDAPVANADSYGVDEGATLAGATVKANDTDVEDGTPGGNVSLGTGPSNASAFTLNPDGSFSYTHDGSETTTDSFTYTVQDSAGAASNVATVTITVNPVDDGAADAVDDDATVAEDSGANVIDVLANDSADPDDSSLAVTAVGAAGNGSTSFTAGNVSYTPDADYCGPDSFTYTVNGGADTATVTVTVTCVDDGPALANADSANVMQNSTANLIDVLANDVADPDDGLVLNVVGTPANGTAIIDGSQISYTPNAGYCGPDSFTYEVNGGIVATVTVSVTCLAPEIFADGFED